MIEKGISEIIKGQDKLDLYIAIIDALNKQIPYKPKPYKDFAGKCKCGCVLLYKSAKYCGYCGQKLDWKA